MTFDDLVDEVRDRLRHDYRRVCGLYPRGLWIGRCEPVGSLLEVFSGCLSETVVLDGRVTPSHLVWRGLAELADADPTLLWAALCDHNHCQILEHELCVAVPTIGRSGPSAVSDNIRRVGAGTDRQLWRG